VYSIELANVSKHYPSRAALDAVDLRIPSGSSVGLLGPNGAGKSTILRLLLGFTQPTSGSVLLQGLPPSDPAARRGVGYLPERLVLPERTMTHSFLRLHGRLAGLEGAELEREIERVSELTGVADRLHEPLGSLSKGLAQRVGFAQAFLGRPKLLLLDEPTSGLDPIGMRDARQWIDAARQEGSTVLVSSHVLSQVERTCDRVVILHQGRVAAEGPIGEIVREGEELEDAFVRLVGGDSQVAGGSAK
jgi:ABC-2 type transport system ATP-binding protein